MDITVADNPDLRRFEALLPTGEVAGFATYQKTGASVVFLHTEVFDRYEGEGVGSTLVRGALDQVRDEGLSVKPVCPFVKAYIARHPEYQDLVRVQG